MSSLLNSLQQQFASITAEITNKLLKINNNLDDSEKKYLFSQIDQHLEETKELLEQIDLEIHALKSTERKPHLIHFEGFRKEYDKLKNDFIKAKQSLSDESVVRIELLGYNETEMDDSKAQLLSDTQRLEASQRKLESGYKLCVETEDIGSQILDNLNSQRDTIRRSRDKLRSTNYELGRSSRLLNLMTRRAMQTKALIYFIALIIIIFIIYIIYDNIVHI